MENETIEITETEDVEVKAETSLVTVENENATDENEEQIEDPDYIDREISWLKFNDRVLYQINRKDLPLTEKIKFVGIAASNLDEFISVRFSYIFHQYIQENDYIDKRYYKNLLNKISFQKVNIGNAFLSFYNLILDKVIDVNVEDSKIKKYFDNNIFPMITPIAVDKNKEIPRFNENDLNFFIKLKDSVSKYCFIQIPHELGRLVKIGKSYHFIEDIVEKNLSSIFNISTKLDYIIFKVVKQYDEEVQNDPKKSVIEKLDEVLKKRGDNNIIYLDIVSGANDNRKLIKALYKLLKVPKNHIHIAKAPHVIGLQFLNNKIDIPDKLISEIEPVPPEWVSDFTPKIPSDLFGETSILDYLDNDDLILHHPYDSYDTVIDFMNEAANDKNVVSIKQTLYRVSSVKSPIVKALCDAAQNGKKVTVMLELLARFNEKMNMKLINKLKESGCNVIYSIDNIKTHCKICLVTKVTKKGTVSYSHVSTGNYNEETASVYTDISYFTSRSNIAKDLNSIFNMITGFTNLDNLHLISYSPLTLRKKLYEKFDECVEFAKANPDKKVKIFIKVNSISDTLMVDRIYEVSENKNIYIYIVCRGICSILPRNNICILSIIGRFLEHSRIYTFNYDNVDSVYISSADLLTRNLDRRIEILVPIKDKKCREKINSICDTLLKDVSNSFTMTGSGEFIHTQELLEDINQPLPYKNAHNDFMVK